MKKYASFIALLVICVIIVCIIVIKNYDGVRESYESIEDIKVSHSQKSDVAKVTIVDTYIKGGETYYELTTSVSGTELFTFSQKEYNEIFGEGNTAVDCEIYTLELNAKITNYQAPIFSKYNKLDMKKLTKYKDNPYGFKSVYIPTASYDMYCQFSSSEKEGTYFNYYINCYSSLREGTTLTIEYSECRYSFLGEEDFTEEEIAYYKNNIDEINRYILEALDNY